MCLNLVQNLLGASYPSSNSVYSARVCGVCVCVLYLSSCLDLDSEEAQAVCEMCVLKSSEQTQGCNAVDAGFSYTGFLR